MTEAEREAVLITSLRLHGVHPTWIEWAQKHEQEGGIAKLMEFMNLQLDAQETSKFRHLIDGWKRPLVL